MQQRSKPQKRALRAVIFLLIVVLLYSAAANVLSVNNTWDMRHIRGFYLEPQDSLDVVMLGASELYTACYPSAGVAAVWLYELSAGRVEHAVMSV